MALVTILGDGFQFMRNGPGCNGESEQLVCGECNLLGLVSKYFLSGFFKRNLFG